MVIQELLETVIKRGASDLHLIVGYPPTIRVDGILYPIAETTLDPKEAEVIVYSLLNPEQKELFLVNKEIDFSFNMGDVARFRVNAYFQKGYPAAELRMIPAKISTLDELNLPNICHYFTQIKQGLVLVTGPTGHGKSTTIASMLNEINQTTPSHILTIEDPIEYVYPAGKSLISQRELHFDTLSWEMALRSALREDPDVVLIGEMRDYDAISATVTIAETGHLVFSTLHTNSAAQTIDRIVDVFPEEYQNQIKLQLSNSLGGIISQRLIPQIGGGRIPGVEILMATSAVRTAIREGKTHQIDNIIQTSGSVGMILMDHSLADLVKKGKVSLETAQRYSLRPKELEESLAEKK